jgi:hypothetical protein
MEKYMLHLISFNNERFAVRTEEFTAIGTLQEVKTYLMDCEDIKENSIEAALDEMRKHNHNVADFGVCGTFIFTRSEVISLAVDIPEQAAA